MRWQAAMAIWLSMFTYPAAQLAVRAEPADREPATGLDVQVDAWWVAPRNTDLEYALVGVGDLAGGGDLRGLRQSRSSEPVFNIGWRLASAPSTRLGMRFWEYEDNARSATGVIPQQIGPILASPTFLVFPSFFGFFTADSAEATSRLKATLVEGGIDWTHGLGDDGRLRLEAGVRLFRYERETHVTYVEAQAQLKELVVDELTDTQAIGPRAAVSYDHSFGRFEMGMLLGVGLAFGDLETTNLQTFTVDDEPEGRSRITDPGTTRSFLQLDGELRFGVLLARGWSLRGAYAFQHWSNVERRQRFVAAGTATSVPVDQDVDFEGLRLGVRYEF